MAIEVQFFTDFQKRKNSTKLPTGGTSYGCSIKDGCSILSPEIEIYYSGDNPASLNYAYIPKYKRYYFVSDWTYYRGTWNAKLNVDVLASNRTYISGLTPYVLRSSGPYNTNMPDNRYPVTNSWAASFTNIPFTSFAGSSNNCTYVIGIYSAPANYNIVSQMGPIKYYGATASDLRTLLSYLMSDTFINSYLSGSGLSDAVIKNYSNPLEFVASVMAFPYNILDGLSTTERPRIGWFNTDNDTNIPNLTMLGSLSQSLTNANYHIATPTNPFATTGREFLKFPPYTQYELHFEPFGTIPLDSALIVTGSNIYLSMDVDLVSGMARLCIGNVQNSSIYGTYNAQLGVPIELVQVTQDVIGAATSFITGIGGGVMSLLSGNIGGALSNVFDGIGSAVNSVLPQVETKGTNGTLLSYQGLLAHKGPVLKMKYCNVAADNYEEIGRPCCQRVPIASFPGKFFQIQLSDNDAPVYGSEKDMLNSFLSGGFFYE